MVGFNPVGLLRLLRGPGDADRMMAGQLLGTGGIAVLLLGSTIAEPAIADAALWGFGRTLANESASCRIRLLDLAPVSPLRSQLVPGCCNSGSSLANALCARM